MTLDNIKAENIAGEPAHRAKWIGKLIAYGFDAQRAAKIYTQALDMRYELGGFGPAVKALAGCEVGIMTAPVAGKADSREWNQ